jgi:hypothetical protein
LTTAINGSVKLKWRALPPQRSQFSPPEAIQLSIGRYPTSGAFGATGLRGEANAELAQHHPAISEIRIKLFSERRHLANLPAHVGCHQLIICWPSAANSVRQDCRLAYLAFITQLYESRAFSDNTSLSVFCWGRYE